MPKGGSFAAIDGPCVTFWIPEAELQLGPASAVRMAASSRALRDRDNVTRVIDLAPDAGRPMLSAEQATAWTVDAPAVDETAPADTAVVAADDGRARLLVPAGALPDGVGLNDLRLTALEGVDGQRGYAVAPDGLVLTRPITIEIDLDAEPWGVPLVWNASDASVDLVDRVEIRTSPDGDRPRLRAELRHFSAIIIGVELAGFVQFDVTLDRPDDHDVGEVFPVSASVTLARSRGENDLGFGYGSVAFEVVPPWRLGGRFSGLGAVSPAIIDDAPARWAQVGAASFDVTREFACSNAGTARIDYTATARAPITWTRTHLGGIFSTTVEMIKSGSRRVEGLDFTCRGAAARPATPVSEGAQAESEVSDGIELRPVVGPIVAVLDEPTTTYTIEVNDPDDDPLRVLWVRTPDACGQFFAEGLTARWWHPHNAQSGCVDGGAHDGWVGVGISDGIFTIWRTYRGTAGGVGPGEGEAQGLFLGRPGRAPIPSQAATAR